MINIKINPYEFIRLNSEEQEKIFIENMYNIFESYYNNTIISYDKKFKKDMIEFQSIASKWLDNNMAKVPLSERHKELQYMTEYYKSNYNLIISIIEKSVNKKSVDKIYKNQFYPILKFMRIIDDDTSMIIVDKLVEMVYNKIHSIDKKINSMNITPQFVLNNTIENMSNIHNSYIEANTTPDIEIVN